MNTHSTNLSQLSATHRSLSYKGELIAEFPSDICELARLDDKIFVVLDGYTTPPDMLYAGCNLWCVDLNGNLLWKAHQLNGRFYENSLYLKPSPYPSFQGQFYKDLIMLDIEGQPMGLTHLWHDQPVLIDLTNGALIVNGELFDKINMSKNCLKFQELKAARGADLRQTAVEWPPSFLECIKASDQLQVVLKMKRATFVEQIDAIVSAVENIATEVVRKEAMDKIRVNFQSYCRDRMNAFYRPDEIPIELHRLPKLIDELFVELHIEMPPRGPYYGWPAMKNLPLKSSKEEIKTISPSELCEPGVNE